MLKLKLQYFGHLMRRVDSLEKTLMLGGIGGRRRRGRQRMRWLDGITADSMDMSLGGHDWATELINISEVIDMPLAILIPTYDSSNLAFYMMYSAFKLNKKGDNTQPWHSFPNLEPVHCSMSTSNCCFLTWTQDFQQAGKMIWYSHLSKNFPQFVVILTVKGFSVVNETEVDVILEFPCFFYDPKDVAIWSLVHLPFLNPACTSGCSWFM